MTAAAVLVRPEVPGDVPAVRSVHEQAFPTPAEADLVDRLREAGRALVSLVAEVDGEVVGHVLFSPVTVAGAAGGGVGMAPVAVSPAHQGRSVGSALIREGLAACRERGHPFVVVLGAPGYYRRFGFTRASDRGLGNVYGCDDEFMVQVLRDDGLPPGGGLVEYAVEFAGLDGE